LRGFGGEQCLYCVLKELLKKMASAAHGAPSEPLTPTAYIAEHLQNLNNIGGAQTSIVDFSVINLDTLFWTLLMGLITVGFFANRRKTGNPWRAGPFSGLG